jgi:hypothetical protein
VQREDSLESTSLKNDEVFSSQKNKPKLSKKISFNLNESEFLSKRSIENIIYEYGTDLLKSFRVKKLFEMFSNLNGFDLTKWLHQYQSNVLVENFVQALSNLHFDFNWPYPILINELKTTRSFLGAASETNGTINHVNLTHRVASDFEYEVGREESSNSNGDEKLLNTTDQNETDFAESESFDFHLVAQQLANTGSAQSEKELLYIIGIFQLAKCHEWVFLLAIILKNFSILNEVTRALKASEIPINVANNIRQGLGELDVWSRNECCGYRGVIQKIKKL